MALQLENLPRTIFIEREGGAPQVAMIDQRALPGELAWIRTGDWRVVVDAVKTLVVRGAPAIGVAGAAAVMLAAWELAAAAGGAAAQGELAAAAGELAAAGGAAAAARDDAAAARGDAAVAGADGSAVPGGSVLGDGAGASVGSADLAGGLVRRLEAVAEEVASARPTAVNLSWAVQRARQAARDALGSGQSIAGVAETLYGLTEALIAEDEAANRRIGEAGTALLRPLAREKGAPLNILTHCNAGSLATAFYGTALGVVYAAAAEGLIGRVYADETRPVGQGARLTAWELARAGVPVTLICDNMAATMMSQGLVDAVVVGADRIAANGDVANKIGTLGVAVLARHFGIPFYVAAPASTIDRSCANGVAIPIEERPSAEVLPEPIAGVEVRNPAFDVTPAELITALITDL